MWRFVWRRLAQAVAVLAGVNLASFVLFFAVNTPDDMARLNLGDRRVTAAQVAQWKAERGYDRPLWLNPDRQGAARLTDTVFWTRSASLFALSFGRSDTQAAVDIGDELRTRAGVSLGLAVPVIGLLLVASTLLAAGLVLVRHTRLARGGLALCGLMLAVSTLVVLVLGQWLWARLWRLAPVSGYAEGWAAAKFLALPVGLAVLARLGGEVRFQRTVLLEALRADHVRAALARGLPLGRVVARQVLRHALVPILTNVGNSVPVVCLGSVAVEHFFGLPGLGAWLVEAIAAQDFAVVRSLVFVGAALVVVTMAGVDVACAWADPRVRRG